MSGSASRPGGTPAAGSTPRPRWWLFAAVVVAWLITDQITKYLALANLTDLFTRLGATTPGARLHAFLSARPPEPIGRALKVVVSFFWSFVYTENRGAMGSLGAQLPDALRLPIFYVISTVAFFVIVAYYGRVARQRPLLAAALPLLAGGDVGNLVDRLARGYVIDFVDWHLNDPTWSAPGRHWLTFNVADVGITVGVSLVLLDGLLATLAERRAARRPAA